MFGAQDLARWPISCVLALDIEYGVVRACLACACLGVLEAIPVVWIAETKPQVRVRVGKRRVWQPLQDAPRPWLQHRLDSASEAFAPSQAEELSGSQSTEHPQRYIFLNFQKAIVFWIEFRAWKPVVKEHLWLMVKEHLWF